MIGKYGGFNPPRYSFQLRAASIALGAGMWWYFLSMGTEHGAYTFGFRTPWVDHPPTDAFMKHNEVAWQQERDTPDATMALGEADHRH